MGKHFPELDQVLQTSELLTAVKQVRDMKPAGKPVSGDVQKQLEANGLQEGEPGALEHLDTDIHSPLANAYADLFIRADLAIRLLDALWVQGGLTDSGHQERTRAVHGAALGILGETRRAHARCRHRIEVQYLGREAAALTGTRPKPSAHPS